MMKHFSVDSKITEFTPQPTMDVCTEYPVPVPDGRISIYFLLSSSGSVPAQLFPETGYLNWIK